MARPGEIDHTHEAHAAPKVFKMQFAPRLPFARSPRFARPFGSALIAALITLSSAAHADTLTDLLKNGPLAQVDVNDGGVFKKSRVLIDIDAPIHEVWAVLTDFRSYPKFMPTCEEVEVKVKGEYTMVEFELDTPLISTEYTSRYKMDVARHRIDILVVDGDNKGSFFLWELFENGNGTRVRYSGLVKNFSSIVERLDDDEQTITIGVNVVSLLQGSKALRRESERRHRVMAKKK